MISDACLGRLEAAVRGAKGDAMVMVNAEDLFIATRELRAGRITSDKYNELKDAIEVIGRAFKGHRGDL